MSCVTPLTWLTQISTSYLRVKIVNQVWYVSVDTSHLVFWDGLSLGLSQLILGPGLQILAGAQSPCYGWLPRNEKAFLELS